MRAMSARMHPSSSPHGARAYTAQQARAARRTWVPAGPVLDVSMSTRSRRRLLPPSSPGEKVGRVHDRSKHRAAQVESRPFRRTLTGSRSGAPLPRVFLGTHHHPL